MVAGCRSRTDFSGVMSPGKIPTFHPQRPYVESNDDPSFRKRVLSPLSHKGMCIISLAPSRRWESNPPIPAYEAGAHPRKPRRRGATSRSRTGDLIRTKDALFQLSYGGVEIVDAVGAAPRTRTWQTDLRRIGCYPQRAAGLHGVRGGT